ncbi:MAG: SpoIIE family protein phosphatase [Acidobacteriota bacterium]|nr:SpoIIE family protein phosphatase [Acidobacteriota bacterium]
MSKTRAIEPAQFIGLFLLTALPLVVVAVRNAYTLVNMGTDQNLFDTSNSRFYLSRDIQGALLISAFNTQGEFLPESLQPRTGDLVISIDGRTLKSYADVDAALNRDIKPARYTVEVQRPDRHEHFLVFQIPASQLPSQAIWEIPPSVYVFDVTEGGASSLAGMQRGDLIYQIDGKGFETGNEAHRLVVSTMRGQTVDYGVIRRGAYITLTLTMSRLAIPMGLALFLFSGFFMIGFGLLLALWRPGMKGARLLSFGFLLVGAGFMLHDHPGTGISALFPEHWQLLGRLAFFLGVATLLHGAFYFPRENTRLLKARIWRLGVYPLALIAAAWSHFIEMGGIAPGMALLFAPQLFYRLKQRVRITGEQARLERYLVFAVSFALVGIIGWSFIRDNLAPVWDMTVRGITALVVLVAYMMTIVRFRLLGISVKRGPLYTMTYGAWLVFVWGLFLLLIDALAFSQLNLLNINLTSRQIEILNEVTPALREHNEKLTLMLITLFSGYLFYRITLWGRIRLRRKFHRTGYDALKASSELTNLLSSHVNLEDLAQGLSSSIARRLLLKRVSVLVFDEEGRPHCMDAGAHDDPEWRLFCSTEAHALSDALEGYRTTLRVDYLTGDLKEALREMGFRYVQPIRSKTLLAGCLLAGEKLAETAFSTQDFQFLAAAANQAAVAIENARLYGKLAHRERLEHELALARHIQISSLPQEEPSVPGMDISGTSIPALEVGGDYYAYFTPYEHLLTVIVADVSGKGTSAALYMSKMQGIFASLHAESLTPKELFLKANPILYRETEKNAFVTALCAQFDTDKKRIRLARAGHIPMLCFHTNSRAAKAYQPPGLGLGVENKGLFNQLLVEEEFGYEPNDVFLLLTDGITEAHDQEFRIIGEARIMELLKQNAHRTAAAIRGAILDELADFTFGAEQRDDMTMVVIKIADA